MKVSDVSAEIGELINGDDPEESILGAWYPFVTVSLHQSITDMIWHDTLKRSCFSFNYMSIRY